MKMEESSQTKNLRYKWIHFMEDNSTKRKRQKPRSIFGEQLEKIAQERGLSHRSLAEMAGVSISVIGSWIGMGGAIPSDLLKVKRLADALNVDFSWLVLGEESKISTESNSKSVPPGELEVSEFWKIEIKKVKTTLRI